jgi:hypothetical protein
LFPKGISCFEFSKYKKLFAGCPWLTPIILTTQEVEIKRIAVQSQPGQIVCETLHKKNRAGGVAQGEGPEFKPQFHNKKKRKCSLKPFNHHS